VYSLFVLQGLAIIKTTPLSGAHMKVLLQTRYTAVSNVRAVLSMKNLLGRIVPGTREDKTS
jgi:hypothetical protein